MATITTDTFLDGGVARTAGETWTISTGTLTVRTDTRWHANAPASMTGTFGAITLNQSGGFYVDGTSVRWMPFDSGTGNVPAIGTTITQGGVSGYFLGVWATVASAPTAVGAAMPASGFIKFRSVTGGPFSSGALTGIGASATGPDVTGWIEVVFDSTTNNQHFVNTGLGWKTVGDWFYLDNTTGVRGQIISTPINGGGTLSRLPGVQIETAPGSGVFEWWPAVDVGPWTNAATRLVADDRNKLVYGMDSGQIQIGSDGTNNVGALPPSGCRVRIPNIIMRQATTAARASNTNVATSINSNARLSNGTGNGVHNYSKTLFAIAVDAANCLTFEMVDCCFHLLRATSSYKSCSITRSARGQINNTVSSGNVLSFDSNIGTLTVSDLKFYKYATEGTTFGPYYGLTCDKLELFFHWSTTSYPAPTSVSGFSNTFTNTRVKGISFQISCPDSLFANTDYIENLHGPTTTSGSQNIFLVTANNVTIDGLTFGHGGAIANTHPRAATAIVSVNTGAYGFKIRNFGTFSSPLSCGSTTNTYPSRIVQLLANTGNAQVQSKVQRLYVANVQTEQVQVGDRTVKNVLIESVSAIPNSTPSGQLHAQDMVLRDLYFNAAFEPSGFGITGALGTNFMDFRQASTNGRIYITFLETGSQTSPFVTTNFGAGSGFDSNSVCRLVNNGDFIIVETPHWIYGHVTLGSAAITNSGNVTFEYQIDKGSGYGGTWKTLNTTNLVAEGNVSSGFKMKVRARSTSNNTANIAGRITIPTTTGGAAPSAPPYPLDTSTMSFTGLVAGSEVRCYTGTDPATAVEIGGTESSGTTFSFSHTAGGQVGFIRIFALGYQPVNYDPYTFSASDTTLLVQQTVDRNYVNP